jgi:hypothetical protein
MCGSPSPVFLHNLHVEAVIFTGHSLFLLKVLKVQELEQFALVKKSPDNIRYIENPTVRIQMSVVYADPYCVRFIANPSTRVQVFAATRYEDVLCYLHEPSEYVILSVISEFPRAIRYVSNPSKLSQIRAAYLDPTVLSLIDNPDRQAQWVAVRGQPSLAFELNLSDRLKRIAARSDPSLLAKYETNFDTAPVYHSLVMRGADWRNPYVVHENKHKHDWSSVSHNFSE